MSMEELDIAKYPKVWHHYDSRVNGVFSEGQLTITEKLDGGNFRFALREEDGEEKVIFGRKRSREGDENNIPDSSFKRAMEYVADIDNLHWRIKDIEEKYGGKATFFAENMIMHSLDYEWENVPPLLGFDVYIHRDNSEAGIPQKELVNDSPHSGFIKRFGIVEQLFFEIGIPTVPVIRRVDAEDFDPENFMVPNSKYRDGQAEGVVIRNEKNGIKTKIVSDQFEEVNHRAFGKRGSDLTDTERFCSAYCTNQRIKKIIIKMVVDEGEDLHMSLMEDLPRRVFVDIWEENANDIYGKRWELDFGKVNGRIADRCRRVLKRMVQNHSMTGADPEKLF